ncbi:MAG: cytochrome ubiquinol oxidase subunit I [Desulfuromonadales bacterium]|nr:cytochrome ubiquinol oxidase subunit I [Desulfuromonadales bacterium]
MLEQIDFTQVNWARAQFALTAMYHWIFVPLTLGLSFLLAFFESLYVKTGNEEWKRITRFWMSLFAINFAIGIATGIIMEFEFGTNWSNYSWMVGDIFGAPLAIEGIFAFFIEATFFAVMFFGWDRVSKKTHLFATWMVAIGSNLSALWILVANGWMQLPVGMTFNPDLARFEMTDFAAVLFSPVAISKFTHTSASGFMLASIFVVAVSSWFLLKQRHLQLARRSILVATVFGLIAGLFVAFSGDEAAFSNARYQPMKLAAMEALYDGDVPSGLVPMGILDPDKQPGDDQDPFLVKVEVPGVLSLLANRIWGSFVPGINDLVYGNPQMNIVGAGEKIERGRRAIDALGRYKEAKKGHDEVAIAEALAQFRADQDYLGYGYLQRPEDIVPPVALTFYSFRIMVILGSLLLVVMALFLYFAWQDRISEQRWLLRIGVVSLLGAYLTSEMGWVVAEVGRQPWAIQGLLPVTVANSNLTTGTVQTTFFLFLLIFTTLLIAEIRIMLKQIQRGPEDY